MDGCAIQLCSLVARYAMHRFPKPPQMAARTRAKLVSGVLCAGADAAGVWAHATRLDPGVHTSSPRQAARQPGSQVWVHLRLPVVQKPASRQK